MQETFIKKAELTKKQSVKTAKKEAKENEKER